jgi:arylsulfatase A-like enzyme
MPREDVVSVPAIGEGLWGTFWREGKIAPDLQFDEVTPRFFQEAETVIKSHTSKDTGKPLFLYLALPSPHTPWLPLEEFRGKSGAGMYGDFVLQVDAGVGRILDALKAAGIDEDTLVLFSSDNGPVWYDKDVEKFGHDAVGGLRGMKFSSWEGGHRMPFLVRWPRRVKKGRVCEQTVVFSDVLATFAELVGLETIPDGMAEDSVSFLGNLLYRDMPCMSRQPIIHNQFTIRDGDWKLILPKQRRKAKANATAELYNLKTDLAEKTNLISKHSEIAERLKLQLSSFLERSQ